MSANVFKNKEQANIVELPEIYECLLSGLSDAEIMAARGGKTTQIKAWRTKFMLQLCDLKLDLLADWIMWERHCRLRQLHTKSQ